LKKTGQCTVIVRSDDQIQDTVEILLDVRPGR
jgi:hypothetical protein